MPEYLTAREFERWAKTHDEQHAAMTEAVGKLSTGLTRVQTDVAIIKAVRTEETMSKKKLLGYVTLIVAMLSPFVDWVMHAVRGK